MGNKIKYVIFVSLLIAMISVAAAADVEEDDSTSITKITSTDNNQAISEADAEITNIKTIDKKYNNKIVKTTLNHEIIDETSFDILFNNDGTLADNVSDGDSITFYEDISKENRNYSINKMVNIYGNGHSLNLNTISGYNLPTEIPTNINFSTGASNSYITGLTFYNTQVYVNNSSNIIFDNITVNNIDQGVGKGVGVFSIRDGSFNITVRNSNFLTKDNTGCSNLVLAYANNCTIENNNITGIGHVGNLLYTTTYNTAGVDYMDTSVNQYNYFHNNIVRAYNITGGVCIGVVVSGHGNTYDGNNISSSSAFSGQWISPYANYTGNFSEAYEGNNYINNWVNGSFTGTKNSTINNNIFLKTVSIPDRCKFRYNNASTVTVTVTGPDGCLKGNTIKKLVVKPEANVTYNCTGNVINDYGKGSLNYIQNCNCTECNNENVILKKSSRNLKSDGEVTVVETWVSDADKTYATLYSNGTLVIDVTEETVCDWGPWTINQDFLIEGILEFIEDEIASEYYVKEIIVNQGYTDCDDFDLMGAGYRSCGYDPSSEYYPNLMGLSLTVNFYEQDEDFSYSPCFIDFTPFKHITINNLVGGTNGYLSPVIFGNMMGVTPNIQSITFNNLELYNPKGLWIENVPEVNFINSKITLKSNMTIKNSTVNFINSELNIEYETDDDTYIPTDYAIDVDGNLNIENSIITIKNLKEIKLGSNNNITKNTITTDSENTIIISGSNNIVTGNTLTSKEKTGDDTVIVSLEGENNIIDNSDRTATKVTIIAPEKININEEVPVTILFQDVDGQLLANDYISIIVGDADPEPVQTDENGMYIYTLTATQPGTLTFTVEVDKSKKHFENSTSKEFIVNEDKDAIIAELNNTIQEQNDKINELTEQNAALNDTINSQAERIDDLEEQIGQLTAAKATTLTLDPVTDVKYNTNVTITGTLVNEDGIALSNQVVTITIGEKTADVKTRNGEFKYTTSFKTLDEQTVTASYAGSEKYLASEDTASFTPEKGDVVVTFNPITDVKYGENVTITGKFTTSDGKAISNSNVKITINGRKYYAKTDKTGAFTLSAKVTATGENEVTIGYSGNANYNAYETTTTFNVEKQDVTVTYEPINDVTVGENVTITGTFTDVNGNAVKNSNVKIIIDGKKYYAKTDSNGVYTFTAAMTKAGVKTVSIGYSGNTNYNEYTCETTFTVLEKA